MTDPVETIVCEPVPTSKAPATIAMPFTRIAHGGTEFLDEAWAEEFDRRLAAWESELPAPATVRTNDSADDC